jgi:peptidyl-prolyl cis-trans isomerase C
MKKMLKSIVISLAATALVAGCASSPDVPEQTEERNYRSTEGEQTSGSADQSSAESGDQSAASGAQGQASASDRAKPRGTGGIPEATGPIATVDGEEIPASEFNTEIQRIAKSGQFPQHLLPQFTDQIVERIVDKHLIDAKLDEANIDVSDKDVEARMEQLRKEYAAMNEASGGQPDASLEDYIGQMGISAEDFEKSVAESLEIERLLEKRGMEMPGEKEAKEFYQENTEKFRRPAQVRARHILIKVPSDAADKKWEEAFAKIEKIRKTAVAKDTDFAKLAEKKSEGPSATKGGDLGYFGKGQMVPEFEKTVFAMDPGEVSEPVKTQFGWHIIKLVDKREEGPVPFEELEGQLTAQLKNRAIQNSLQDLVVELRENAEIELHLDNIE